MTFGKELARLRQEHPLFANHYIAYQELKDAAASGEVPKLMRLLQQELDRINDLVSVEMAALRSGLQVRYRKATEGSTGFLDAESIDNLAEAIDRMHQFVEVNYQGFQKIMKRCSERQDTASCTWFLAQVQAAPFRHYSFDELLVPLGQLRAAHRQQRAGQSEATMSDIASKALSPVGEGQSQVFFVQAKDVMRVKLALLQKLSPVGAMCKAKTTQATRDTSRMVSKLSRRTVHIYLEGASGNQYAERYRRRVEGSAAASGSGVLLRCRLAAAQDGEPGTIEDLTDPEHEAEIDVEDEAGRVTMARLPQRLMNALMEGTVDAKHRSPASLAAAEVIKRDGLRPAVSASFIRSSFAADSKDSAAPELVSIDEAIFFRDEAALADTKAWCFAASKTGAATVASPQVDFPGAVLRVWLPPQESAELIRMTGLEKFDLQHVPSFSEAMHGMALVHRELATPLPPWIPSETLTPTYQRSSLFIPKAAPAPALGGAGAGKAAGKPKEGEKTAAGGAPGGGSFRRTLMCCAGRSARAPDMRLKVDCKTPLAIERTLLRWMRSTVLLASLSSFLVSASSPSMQLNGLLLGLVSIVFVALPAHNYWCRSIELMNPASQQPKVDRFMPTAMAWSFSVIMLATLVVNVTTE
eukprot:CAMPEP_0176040592 /NCGR_PEP_ID=MMETSP0120_2-20121206/20128_1 /TAXON_ID=160619 /ORGANISM="Kryptoperidinium foliaceum, Strain CCMP 1326" /LENGTH=639 /DNA_ID=CAMNT_0017373989 /DNA_START=27 /DNA_END=1946 /DNA_ORIENTATION=-